MPVRKLGQEIKVKQLATYMSFLTPQRPSKTAEGLFGEGATSDLKSSIFACCFVESNDIFYRCIGLQIMARGQDETGSVARKRFDQPFDFGSNFLNRAEWQRVLVVPCAV